MAMARQPTIVLIDDDREIGRLLERALRDEDPSFRLECFEIAGDGERGVAELAPECVLLDYRLPDGSGLDCLRRLRRSAPEVPVVMLTGADSVDLAVEAMKLGAVDYVVKHGRYLRTVAVKVREAVGRRQLSRVATLHVAPIATGDQTNAAGAPRAAFGGIVGASPALQQAVTLVGRAARSTVPVLLEGESGAGKELFAHAVHEQSARSRGPFLAQNCAALPEALLESELFGHVRGAFTGADRDRRGLFEAATGGTLFLDEVSETSVTIQAKLLRVLQEGEVRPLGSTAPRRVDVRIVSAANVDLTAAVRDGRFRQDLYYRLRVFPVRVPPLREREGDVALLVRHFVELYSSQENLPIPELLPEVHEALRRYAWPGNVRELQNEVHRLVLCAEPGRPIEVADLSPPIAATLVAQRDDDRPLKAVVRDIEVAMIVERLRENGNNREATARSLGITREALWAKMRKLGLEVGRRRGPAEGETEEERDEE
jgi:DNA-binding NtrC family response regulator